MSNKISDPLETNILLDNSASSSVRHRNVGPYLISDSVRDEQDKLLAIEREEKLPFLFKKYDIDATNADCWKKLALALATEYCTGFKWRLKQGAPQKMTVQKLSDLYRYFIRERARIRLSKSAGSVVSDASVCNAVSGAKKIGMEIPELANVGSKRLRNLVSEATAMRREYVTFIVRDLARKRTNRNSDWFFSGDPPSWHKNHPEK